jgi:hypothetical protein
MPPVTRACGSFWLLGLGLFVLALAPRVGPALRGYQWSPDGSEYLLLARSLARGDGYVLPVQVRFGPAVASAAADGVTHSAYGERAPLWPWLLSLPVRAGLGRAGWPDPRLQLLGALLACLAAPLAASIAVALARRQGLGPQSTLLAALCAGLVVAWAPSLVRASIHLWAEPLGVVLALAATRMWLALDPGPGTSQAQSSLGLAAALGVAVGLARFARPEAWVLVPAFLVLLAVGAARAPRDAASSARGAAWAAILALVVVNVAGWQITGVLAPQLDLFAVGDYRELMRQGEAGRTTAPGAGEVVAGVARNLASQVGHLLLPKNAFFVLPLALIGARRAAARPLVVLAAALGLAAAMVWSTDDPHRFTIAPLCLLAPVAAVEAELLRRRLCPRSPWPLAIYLALLVGLMGHAAGRELRGRPLPPAPTIGAQPGTPSLADPWSYALITGRPARLERPVAAAGGVQ